MFATNSGFQLLFGVLIINGFQILPIYSQPGPGLPGGPILVQPTTTNDPPTTTNPGNDVFFKYLDDLKGFESILLYDRIKIISYTHLQIV